MNYQALSVLVWELLGHRSRVSKHIPSALMLAIMVDDYLHDDK